MIEQARRRRGISRQELARRTGIDRVTIWRIETGQVVPRRSTWLLLAGALGILDVTATLNLDVVPGNTPAPATEKAAA